MIRPLRRRHRRLVLGLALTVPPLFVAALASRDLPRPMERIPPALLAPGGPPMERAVAVADLWPGIGLSARIGRDPADGNGVVELAATAALPHPDVLLYWMPDAVVAGDALPPDARLLGHVTGHRTERFGLPASAAAGEGTLALYSLAHQELFAAAPLPAPEP